MELKAAALVRVMPLDKATAANVTLNLGHGARVLIALASKETSPQRLGGSSDFNIATSNLHESVIHASKSGSNE